jgi:hypothetical protein
MDRAWASTEGHPKQAEKDTTVRFVHIPKSGVSSLEASLWGGTLKTFLGERDFVSNEDCLYFSPKCPQGGCGSHQMAMMREPRSQAFSSYLECAYHVDGWVAEENVTVPVSHQKDANLSHSQQFKLDVVAFNEWLDHFNSSWQSNHDSPQSASFNCFHPGDIATRYLSERGGIPCHYSDKRMRSAADYKVATLNMRQLFYIGLTEEFDLSKCMLIYQLHGNVPEYCKCGSSVEAPVEMKDLRDIPRYNYSHLDEATQNKIAELTQQDVKLYEDTVKEFWTRIYVAEDRLGFKLKHSTCVPNSSA